MKMTEVEIVKRAIENTEEIYEEVIEDTIRQCIQFDEEINLGTTGTTFELEKDTYNVQNVLKLHEELLERSFIECIEVDVYDSSIVVDVSYKHKLSTYDSLLFENYVYAKLDYGF